jgi:hypothetical protein
MSRSSTLILLGLCTILAPYSGLPVALRTLFTVIFGAAMVGIGILMRSQEIARRQPPQETAVESPPVPQGVSPI